MSENETADLAASVNDEPSAGALLAEMGTDAQRWAREFVRQFAGRAVDGTDGADGAIDEGTLIGWFAGAIENARSAQAGRADMYESTYWQVQEVLDDALGHNEEDGVGEGVATDVRLLVAQRDDARTKLFAIRTLVSRWRGMDRAASLDVGEVVGGVEAALGSSANLDAAAFRDARDRLFEDLPVPPVVSVKTSDGVL
jgi:hypothetical protein